MGKQLPDMFAMPFPVITNQEEVISALKSFTETPRGLLPEDGTFFLTKDGVCRWEG